MSEGPVEPSAVSGTYRSVVAETVFQTRVNFLFSLFSLWKNLSLIHVPRAASVYVVHRPLQTVPRH